MHSARQRGAAVCRVRRRLRPPARGRLPSALVPSPSLPSLPHPRPRARLSLPTLPTPNPMPRLLAPWLLWLAPPSPLASAIACCPRVPAPSLLPLPNPFSCSLPSHMARTVLTDELPLCASLLPVPLSSLRLSLSPSRLPSPHAARRCPLVLPSRACPSTPPPPPPSSLPGNLAVWLAQHRWAGTGGDRRPLGGWAGGCGRGRRQAREGPWSGDDRRSGAHGASLSVPEPPRASADNPGCAGLVWWSWPLGLAPPGRVPRLRLIRLERKAISSGR